MGLRAWRAWSLSSPRARRSGLRKGKPDESNKMFFVAKLVKASKERRQGEVARAQGLHLQASMKRAGERR